MKCQELKQCKKLQHNVLMRTQISSQKEGHDTAEKAVEEAAEWTICDFLSKVSMFSMCVGGNATNMPTCMWLISVAFH